MELTRTVNADKRYYIDEGLVTNPEAFLETVQVFNDAKMYMYNLLYDTKYLGRGPLADGAKYPALLKGKYGANDYYNAAVYSAASGQVSSQQELRKFYQRTVEADIRVRQVKIQSTEEELAKKQAMKGSIRTYAKGGKWKRPYPKCQMKVSGSMIQIFGGTAVPVQEYERSVEEAVRRLKHKLAMLREGLGRKEKRLEHLKTLPPERIVFGTKKLYAQKDALGGYDKDIQAWKQGFSDKRHRSMTLPGRHTSKYCNFLCRFDGCDLHVTCMDGSETVFRYFELSRYGQHFRALFQTPSYARKPVCYSFTINHDRDGRAYIIPSATFAMETYENFYYGDGAVAMDINYDHLAVSELGRDGGLLGGHTIHFDPEGKSSGQMRNIIGMAVKEVFGYCMEKKKNLIIEDIDLTVKRHSLKYGSRTGNRHASLFAYHQVLSSVQNQCLRTHVGFRMVDPAYTSQMGKFLYMRKFGISIHQAASYTIGLVGLEKFDKLTPDARMLALMKDKDGSIPDVNEGTYRSIWRRISTAFSEVKKHAFYRAVPYDILQAKKRLGLKALAAAMKEYA